MSPKPAKQTSREALIRHIVALSGGKDSAALALHLKGKIECEYIFCDTGRELPEVYTFLGHLETILGPIARINDRGRDFDWHLEHRRYFLPTPFVRWCTTDLKIRPFDRHIGKDESTVYIGLRADEDRDGNYGSKKSITYRYPLREDGVDLAGVRAILSAAGVPLPDFYRWRSTGGCWCCPFQRKSDWAGLKMFHPDLFQRAVEDEAKSIAISESKGSKGFTWRRGQPLSRIAAAWQPPMEMDDWEYYTPCLICAK